MQTDGRILVTSVIRYADQQQASGFARILNLNSGETLMKSPVPESVHRARDLNPRGG